MDVLMIPAAVSIQKKNDGNKYELNIERRGDVCSRETEFRNPNGYVV